MVEEEESQPLASQQDNVLVRLDGEDSSDDDDDEDDSHNNVGIPEKHGKSTPTKSVLDSDEEDFETEDDEDLGEDVAPVTLKEISVFNLLDFHLQMTIKEPKWRMQHWEASVFYLGQYAFAGKTFGRIWSRRLLAGILVDLHAQPAYGENPQQMKKQSIVNWTKGEWHDLIQNLKKAQTACRRQDRNLVVLRDSDSANQSVEDFRCLNSARMTRMLSICETNQVLAPVRCRIETQIMAGKTGAPVVNDEKVLAVFMSICQSKNPVVLEYCLKLFRRKEKSAADDDADKENDSLESGAVDDKMNPQLHEPVLKDVEELNGVLEANPFNLNWLVNKFENVVNEWHDGTLDNSILKSCRYSGLTAGQNKRRLPTQTTPESGAKKHRKADLSGLKRSRAALNNNHGEDPLDESREIAKECTGVARGARDESSDKRERERHNASNNSSPPTPNAGTAEASSKEKSPTRGMHFYEEKKVKSRLSFSDDESDDKDKRSPQRAKLSGVSPQRRLSPAGPKAVRNGTFAYYNGPPPDEGVFDELGNVVRRIPWSVDETNCIIAALQRDKSLVGNWVGIKNMYSHQLRNRNTVQIKDKFRNLQKTAALDFLKDPEQEQDNDADEEIEDVEESEDC